jgi:predicted dehydrogenase
MTLRVACVGAGYFAQLHYESWHCMDRATLVGACDLDLAKAQATGLPAYTDTQEMLIAERPDLLDVILPPTGHAETIRMTLAHGIKYIICQKPFCEDLEEARIITEDVAAAGATLIIHENFRFQPWYRTIKTAIDAGDIGDVLQVTFRLRPGDGQGPEAYLNRQPYFQQMPRFLVHETAVHWIDTFRFLLGDPLAVYADLRRINPVIAGEDAGVILFDHPNGVRALFDGNRHLDHAAENKRCTMGEALVEGTGGSLTLTGDGTVWLRAFDDQRSEMRLAPTDWPGFGGNCVHHLQQHVVSGILDGTPLENTGPDYLKVIEIEQAIYASAESGTRKGL